MGTIENIGDRLRVAVLGKVNDLLDPVANTTSAYRQRIRDLQEAMAQLRAAKDEAVGTVNGYASRLTGAQTKLATNQADIDLLLGDDDPSNDGAALQLQLDNETLNDDVANLTSLQADAQDTADKIDQALQKLDAHHKEMVGKLNKLTLTEASTKAKNRASHAVEAAEQANNAIDNVDSIEARLQHDNDTANARFERVFGQVSAQSPEEEVKVARAKAALEARRAQITQQASTTETPAG